MKSISDVLANQGLFADAGVGAMCSDTRGRLLWTNEVFARLYCRVAASEATGRLLSEYLPEPAAQERLEIIRGAITGRRRTVVRDIWGGIAVCAVLEPLAPHDDAPDGSLLGIFRSDPSLATHAPAASAPIGQEHEVRTRTWDLGPLAPLSRRELEILALLGEGLSNAQVAELVHRTVKTVEFHRASISAKTKIDSRVKLARAAQTAGLYERLRAVGYRVPDINDLDRDLQTVGEK